jgi:hypothetical protein
MIDVEQKRTIWTGVSLVRIDERERGVFLNSFIVGDVNTMFEGSPFSARIPVVLSVQSNRVVEKGD